MRWRGNTGFHAICGGGHGVDTGWAESPRVPTPPPDGAKAAPPVVAPRVGSVLSYAYVAYRCAMSIAAAALVGSSDPAAKGRWRYFPPPAIALGRTRC